jgi:hypothetical protein
MYVGDHPLPHFHAHYGEDKAKYLIADGSLDQGSLPSAQDRRVRKWAQEHREELERNWELCENGSQPERIE